MAVKEHVLMEMQLDLTANISHFISKIILILFLMNVKLIGHTKLLFKIVISKSKKQTEYLKSMMVIMICLKNI